VNSARGLPQFIGLMLSLAVFPVWLSAIFLLVVSVTLEGRLFAIGLILLCPLPLALTALRGKRRVLASTICILGLSPLTICYAMSPSEKDAVQGPAAIIYTPATAHRRISPANLVPEIDQHLMGAHVMTVLDPLIEPHEADRLRTLLTNVYGERDAAFKRMPSVLGLTYRDLFTGSHPSGNAFTYIPPGEDRIPVILFLHGSLGNFQGYWWKWKQFADATGMAIVAPSFGAGNWRAPGGLETVRWARDYCANHPRLDAKHIYLAGLSNGGLGVCAGAAADPDAYAGLIFLSPVFEERIVRDATFQSAWKDRKVLIVTGEADDRIPVSWVREMDGILRGAGVRADSLYVPDEDHFLIFSQWPLVQERMERMERWIAEP